MMDHSIGKIQNTIIFVYNVSRFLAFYNLNKIKFYFYDYTSNILSDYKSYIEPNPSVEEQNHEKQVCAHETN